MVDAGGTRICVHPHVSRPRSTNVLYLESTIDKILTFNTYTAKPVCWNGWISDSYCNLKPLCSGMVEVVPARTSPTLLPHPLALCCHYPVSKCRSASIVVTGTVRVKAVVIHSIRGLTQRNPYCIEFRANIYMHGTVYNNTSTIMVLPVVLTSAIDSMSPHY